MFVMVLFGFLGDKHPKQESRDEGLTFINFACLVFLEELFVGTHTFVRETKLLHFLFCFVKDWCVVFFRSVVRPLLELSHISICLIDFIVLVVRS